MGKLKLKPCRYCGSTDAVIDEVERMDLDTGREVTCYAVVCLSCLVCTWSYKTKERAVKDWNEGENE